MYHISDLIQTKHLVQYSTVGETKFYQVCDAQIRTLHQDEWCYIRHIELFKQRLSRWGSSDKQFITYLGQIMEVSLDDGCSWEKLFVTY